MVVNCDYCGQAAKLVKGSLIYMPHSSVANYMNKYYWACFDCGAWVGTHSNSKNHAPLGRLADAELRKLKSECHALFDPLWIRKIELTKCSKSEARKKAYKWLANELGIEMKECHIGMFDNNRCKKAIEVLKKRHEQKTQHR